MFARWEALGQALLDQGGWNDAQVNLALQLLGIGPDLRNQYPELNANAKFDDLSALLSEQLDDLQRLRIEALDPLNAKERELSRLGYPLRPSKEYLQLQRYEGQLRRASNELLSEFRRLQAGEHASPVPIVNLEPESAPKPLHNDPPAPETAPAPVNDPRADSENGPMNSSEMQRLSAKLAATAGTAIAGPRDSPASVPSPTLLPSPRPSLFTTPTIPMNRKARRAQAAVSRQSKASAR